LRRWREGLAPFLIVSGGHVHPNKTAFAEADPQDPLDP
jgi:hypothetical protein